MNQKQRQQRQQQKLEVYDLRLHINDNFLYLTFVRQYIVRNRGWIRCMCMVVIVVVVMLTLLSTLMRSPKISSVSRRPGYAVVIFN